jgi:hypothetical protein
MKIQQDHRIAAARSLEMPIFHRPGQIISKPHIVAGLVGIVKVFEEIDDRCPRIELAQKQCCSKTAVTYDQIGLNVKSILQGLVDGIAIPHRVFKGGGTKMVLRHRSASAGKLDPFEPTILLCGLLTNERGAPTEVADDMMRNMPQLRRKIRVNKKNVHAWSQSSILASWSTDRLTLGGIFSDKTTRAVAFVDYGRQLDSGFLHFIDLSSRQPRFPAPHFTSIPRRSALHHWKRGL